MNITRDDRGHLHVSRGAAKKIRGGSWGSPEASFYRELRDALRGIGEDVIRRVPEKDGHMTSAPYYIRERKGSYCYWHERHQIESAAEVYNAGGTVLLERH